MLIWSIALFLFSLRKRLRLPMFPKLRHDAASDASRRSNRRVTTQQSARHDAVTDTSRRNSSDILLTSSKPHLSFK